MGGVSMNELRDNLKSLVDQVIDHHEPLKATRRGRENFIAVSAEDWEREQANRRP